MRTVSFSSLGIAACLLGMLLVTACETSDAPPEFAARVGDAYLSQARLDSALKGLGSGVDTSEARRQIIEQWVTRTLLLQEAQRLNLEDEPAVQALLEEQTRSVLVSALTNRIYEQAEIEPSENEIQNYFDRHREALRLREPYVRVRHLSTPNRPDAEAARAALVSADEVTDSLWTALARQYAADPASAQQSPSRFVAESRVFTQLPYVRDEVAELRDGDVTPVVEQDSLYHVVHLVRRVSEGTTPELAWVRDDIRRRLAVRARKQMYAREVQRLRNEAQARNALVIR